MRGEGRSDERDRIAIFSREQFGSRHVPGNGMRRIVEGELVTQSPGKDTRRQQCQAERQGAQAGLLISVGDGAWDMHRALIMMMPQGWTFSKRAR